MWEAFFEVCLNSCKSQRNADDVLVSLILNGCDTGYINTVLLADLLLLFSNNMCNNFVSNIQYNI